MQAFLNVAATKSDRPAISPDPQEFTMLIALQKSLIEIRE